MFYIWGSGGDQAVVANAGSRPCAICNSLQPFNLVVNYRYWHFWYVLSFVTRRRYEFSCTRCGNGVVAQPAEYRSLLGKDPIPFMRRRGWMLPALVLAPALAFGMYEAGENDKKMAAWIDAPQVGDVYSVDLPGVSDSFDGKHAYGDMKLLSIEGDQRTFAVAAHAWDRKSALRKDERRNDVHADSYYDLDDTVVLDAARLKALRASGAVFDIQRKP